MSDTDSDLVEELFEGGDSSRIVHAPATPASRFRNALGHVLMVTGAFVTLLVVLYTVDLLVSAGDVPRGVHVAGVDVGGLSREVAEDALRAELQPRLTEPVPVRAGSVEARLDPVASGLGIDWAATVERAGSQPLDPITRLTSLLVTREVGVVTTVDGGRLRESLAELAGNRINRGVIQGDIGFEANPGGDGAVRAFVIEPRRGQELVDLRGAAAIVQREWLGSGPIELPVRLTWPKVTSRQVHSTLERTVLPLISGPVRLVGDGAEAAIPPIEISRALDFTAMDDGLEVQLDRFRLQQAVRARLAGTEDPARDAKIVFAGAEPEVRPANQGRQIDWVATFAPFLEVATQAEARELEVVYDAREPDVTTAEVERLRIVEVVGEFSTDGMSGAVARNVTTMARAVNGAIVEPGETFSLDERTGPRTASQGYVDAPLNEDATGPEVIGGGVSQLTSTLHNAVYLAGLRAAGHTEHPFYLERYPEGRDAVSLRQDGSSVDYAFTNDAPTGVAIQAEASGSSVTVRIWGTERYRVESASSGRSDLESPPIVRRGPGECTPSRGQPGFRVTDTRVLYRVDSNRVVARQSTQVRYEPRPVVLCRREFSA